MILRIVDIFVFVEKVKVNLIVVGKPIWTDLVNVSIEHCEQIGIENDEVTRILVMVI